MQPTGGHSTKLLVNVCLVLSALVLASAWSASPSAADISVVPPDPANQHVSTGALAGGTGAVTAHAGATNVFVEWDPVVDALGYRIRNRIAGRSWRSWQSVPPSALSRNVTGLSRGTRYEVEFQALVGSEWATPTLLTLRTRPSTTVPAVTAVQAEATVDRMMVSWTGGQTGTQFRVAASRNGGTEYTVATTYRTGVALDLEREPGDSFVFAVTARVNGIWATTSARSTLYTVPTGGHTHGESRWVVATEETAGYTEERVPTRYTVFDPLVMNDPIWGITRMGFLVSCPSVTFAAVDPIVSPGNDRTAHLHEFFGNPAVSPSSTTQQLADVPSDEISCSDRNDKSAYWSPAVYQDGRRVTAKSMSVYYKSPSGFEQPIPFGLRMVAGDAAATAGQPSHVGWWEADDKTALSAEHGEMVTRSDRLPIALRMNFPQCWDGVHLDSPDHQSHLAYSIDTSRHDNHFVGTPLTPEDGNGCPETHPVRIPQLTTFAFYDVDGGEGLRLSSGPWYTFHQDFWNAWSPEQLAELTAQCGAVERRMCRINASADLQALGQFWVTIPAPA